MPSSTYANGRGQDCPPAPRLGPIPLPELPSANICMPPPPGPAPGAQRAAHAQGYAAFQGPISPPPSPRHIPGVHFALAQPLVDVVFDSSVYEKPPKVVAHSALHLGIMISPATYPGMTRIILRFSDLHGKPTLAVNRAASVTVQDVVSSVERFLSFVDDGVPIWRLFRARHPFIKAYPLRMEWLQENEFQLYIGN